jgi:chitinase
MTNLDQICEQIAAKKWTVQWDNTQSVPFAYSGDQWVSYDDVKSISVKVG